jgi:hypothetical protein
MLRATLLVLAIPTLLSAQSVDPALAERFAGLALDCVGREYPNKIQHVLQGDGDARPPRELTPAFFGCYDWHSAVHGHWLLLRLLRTGPQGPWRGPARAALERSLTEAHLRAEVAYLEAEGRAAWERPYGLAWLLQLAAELRAFDDPDARRWAAAIEPLEAAVERRLAAWLPKLSHPNRSGEHAQTAFAMGLMLDWARQRGRAAFAELVAERARAFHAADRGWPLRFEPGGQDFLSPGLAAADLMRRVMPEVEFAAWLGRALPDLPLDLAPQGPLDGGPGFLPVAVATDRADGKLAHLDGLNLSRAWMLEGIASGLPSADPRLPALRAAAVAHREAGLAAVTGEHYAGGHWLGSFAVYLVTRRGLDGR